MAELLWFLLVLLIIQAIATSFLCFVRIMPAEWYIKILIPVWSACGFGIAAVYLISDDGLQSIVCHGIAFALLMVSMHYMHSARGKFPAGVVPNERID